MITEKYGYWETNNLKFNNKVEALIYGTKNNTEVKFKYHDEVWKNFDRSQLGKIPLNQLYKERAQQLRDNYKYLVLYYSGGADSHNVLMTFISNNIKLDEVVVRWPKKLLDNQLYKPNDTDRSAKNYWSEWDYVVKPSLDWLTKHYPSIKITIQDYTETFDVKGMENVFENVSHTRAGLLQSFKSANKANVMSEDRTAHIFGIDKPALAVHNDSVYMFFNDLSTTMLYTDSVNDLETTTKECFYWSPDFPLLTFEMAYRVSEYFNINKDKRQFLRPFGEDQKVAQKSIDFAFQESLIIQFQNNIVKEICYDTWDHNKFQADKPTSVIRQDKFYWFFKYIDFQKECLAYLSNMKTITSLIDKKYLSGFGSLRPGIKTMIGDVYFIRKLDL